MSLLKSLLSFLVATLYFTFADAATFDITNKCPYTVWGAASPGGGKELKTGETWTISANPGTTQARIWARTNCQFDASGKGKCETGDCNGLLVCQGYGAAPNTLAEYALDQFEHQDFIDISVIDGFNVPIVSSMP
ncbi:pathogenesis-related protein R major form-like [Hevea brasiliensis]|uniref:pathogenesis-related protein R major form-like n=1 Tax=Hevea brasiliensis TaxID=3981 RepID=UPI0025FA19A7|nr:pathogenesis-related protein R major form-like [Hevea brasiliensis]